jgi:hypothetical protein
MRRVVCLVLVLFVAAMCSAQSTDTSFSSGPQYLITSGTPNLLHSIATPTLSLSAPLAAAPTASPEEGTGEPHTPAFPDLQTQAQINQIYWGVSDTNARTASAENTGVSGEVELTSQPSSVPSSIFNAGVTGTTDAEALRKGGYGVPLGDVAAFWKVNKRQATRAYTNADIARLHGG